MGGQELQRAAVRAEEAWNKSSTLTAAVSYTMVDAVRVVVIGLAQRSVCVYVSPQRVSCTGL
jgi:hypothetical protein